MDLPQSVEFWQYLLNFFLKICSSCLLKRVNLMYINDVCIYDLMYINVNIRIFRKRWGLILGCFFPVSILNMLQYPCTQNDNIYHSNKREPPLFFHWDTDTWPHSCPFHWQIPWFHCCFWKYFFPTLFQRRTSLLGWQDLEEATQIKLLSLQQRFSLIFIY